MALADLRYTKTHEWASLQGDVCTVGITKFAADQLTDVTYIELPRPGRAVKAGEEFGSIETVKAVSPLYSPVAGTITEVNGGLENDPNQVTADPFGASWLVKIKLAPGATLNHLLTLEQYEKQCAAEGH